MGRFFSRHTALAIIFIVLFSLAGGFVNGLLGTGGGIIFAYMYGFFAKDSKTDIKDSLASSMATVVPISVVSLAGYSHEQFSFSTYTLGIVMASALGGIVGAVVSSKLKSGLLMKIFALLVIYAGVNMLL